MIDYSLPESVTIDGVQYAIRNRGDYRVVLDIISALGDEELSDRNRYGCALTIFYEEIPSNAEEALYEMFKFLGNGDEPKEESQQNEPPLMNWEQDFHLLISPISKVLGKDVRSFEYLHWYSFLAAYMEIGDCTFAQVVALRTKLNKGEKLDKSDQEFYNKHKEDVLLRTEKQKKIDDDYLNNW